MILFPPAKINLGLFVTEKRSDGYHSIESVFYPIPLCDCLELLPGEVDGLQFQTLGLEIPADGAENLCQKAYRLLSAKHSLPPIKAALLKNIPTGAGLGGGSSDGSAMIRAMLELSGLDMDLESQKVLAAQLGSDCPFFIESKPAFVSGRGEILESLEFSLKGKHLVLIHPNIHIPTAKAYQLIKPRATEFDLRQLPQLPLSEWKEQVKNDFEGGIFAIHPEIKAIKERLYGMGAAYASMSGSGSAVFGIFDEPLQDLEIFKPYFRWTGAL